MSDMRTPAERKIEFLAKFRGVRPPDVLPVLEMLSQGDSPICAACAVGYGGDWLAREHVEFQEAACMICGKTKMTCGAAHWTWSEVDSDLVAR